MKITAIENFLVDKGGPAPWLFCAIRTDSGITGYSEYGQGSLYKGLPGLIEDLGRSLIGQDPRPVDKIFMDMYRNRRAETGGATAMAMAGIELALWDIKGKDLGVPVYRMVGGPFREKQRVYWSHLATYRVRRAEQLGSRLCARWKTSQTAHARRWTRATQRSRPTSSSRARVRR